MGQRKCLEAESKPADHAGIPLHRPQEATEEVVVFLVLK